MLGMSASDTVWWANEIRIWATATTAIAGFITFGASYAQIRYASVVSREKDDTFSSFKLGSEEATARALAQAAAAGERAALLEKEAAEVRKTQEQIRAQNLQLEQEIERERLARLAVEARLNPRRIKDEIKDQLVQAFSQMAKMKIYINSDMFNSEARVFAADFKDVFKRAGFEILEYTGNDRPISSAAAGAYFRINDASVMNPALPNIRLILGALGIQTQAYAEKLESLEDDSAMLFVSTRP